MLYLVKMNDLLKSLEIFWKGMLAIVIVLSVIFAVTLLMTKISSNITSYKAAQKQDEQENISDDI